MEKSLERIILRPLEDARARGGDHITLRQSWPSGDDRSASVLIREHGEDASLESTRSADKFLEDGNMAGSAVWRRVLKAIEEIQREERAEREAVN